MAVNPPSKKISRMIKFWLPVLVWMGVIFFASSLPGSQIPPFFPFQDIVFHLAIYLILGLFFARALKNTCLNIASARIIFFTTLFAFVYGSLDEFHQAFLPYRSVSGLDVFVDSMGSFIGSLVYPTRKIFLTEVRVF